MRIARSLQVKCTISAALHLIAVGDVLNRAKAPLSLSTKMAGESLFHDGIGVGLFLLVSEPLADGPTKILLTWGGLRGGISVALALALPAGNGRDLLMTTTYTVVAFSILVPGTTMPWLSRRVLA